MSKSSASSHKLSFRDVLRWAVLLVLLIAVFGATGLPFEVKLPHAEHVQQHASPAKTADRYITNADLARFNQSPPTFLTQGATETHSGPLLSLRSACAAELSQLCPTMGSLRCLLDQWESFPAAQRAPPQFSSTCSQWLEARDACFSVLQQIGHVLCHGTAHGRECLRRVPRALLPTKCVNSDYFQSVLLLDAMKR